MYPNEYGAADERGVIAEADIEINAVYMKWSLDGSVSGTHLRQPVVDSEGVRHRSLECRSSTSSSPGRTPSESDFLPLPRMKARTLRPLIPWFDVHPKRRYSKGREAHELKRLLRGILAMPRALRSGTLATG